MSLTSTGTLISYDYQVGTNYSLPFSYDSVSDVMAYYVSAGQAVEISQEDFTINNSLVTINIALPEGAVITFYRNTPRQQNTSLPPNVLTQAIEKALDRNAMSQQELHARTVKVVASGFDPSLPKVIIPNASLKINAAGNGLEYGADPDTVMEQVEEATDQAILAGQYAVNAANSKVAAETAAGNASSSATSAGNSKTAAETAAGNASGSATAAAGSATSAANSKTAAETATSNASSSAQAAANSKTAAETAASNASSSASAAAGSATSATNSKTAAETAASNASSSAQAAANSKTAAETAKAAAETAASSIDMSNYYDKTASDNKFAVKNDAELSGTTKGNFIENVQALGSLSAATTINCINGSVVTATISAALTFTFAASASATTCRVLTLILTNGGAYTITWPTSVKWAGGTAPTLTASGKDILHFITVDNGATWYGCLGGSAFA